MEHWKEEPPIAICLRAWLGVKSSASSESSGSAITMPQKSELTEGECQELAASLKAIEAMCGRARN